MAAPSIAAQHLARSAVHEAAAMTLAASNDDWAAVCYFYAAYRRVLGAFQVDQRLNSDSAARNVDSRMTASSRHVTHHQFHPNRGLGVNDLVRHLYPAIGAKYELLHTKSVEVRYLNGLTAGSLADIKRLYDDVVAELIAQGV
jgi:hypothetical protein